MDYIVKAYKDWKLHSQFQEILPDDMDDAEYMFNEKQSIRDSARTLKKYGSTCCNNHLRNATETLIRHEVGKTDTLQGIALKYGCTTEQIRRANRLFASDSLFLRQFLLIPVDKNSVYYPQTDAYSTSSSTDLTGITNAAQVADLKHTNGSSSSSSSGSNISNGSGGTSSSRSSTINNSSSNCSSDGDARPAPLPARPYSIAGELLIQNTHADDPALRNNHNANTSKQSKSLDSVVAMTPDEENRKCINDFLNKIDNTISESRKYVERSKDMITSQSDDDLFVTTDIVQRRRNNELNNSYKNDNNSNRTVQLQRHSSNGSGNSDTAQLLNTTQTRRVQNSLKRLEKQQDDFFEL